MMIIINANKSLFLLRLHFPHRPPLLPLSDNSVQTVPQIIMHIISKFHLPDRRIPLNRFQQLLSYLIMHRIEPDIIFYYVLIFAHQHYQLMRQIFNNRLTFGLVIQQFNSCICYVYFLEGLVVLNCSENLVHTLISHLVAYIIPIYTLQFKRP